MPKESDVLLRLRGFSLARRVDGGERALLEGIDLDLRAGRWLAVLGANGSGKSSLLKYLASEDSPLADAAAIVFQDPDDQIIAATVEQELALGGSAGGPVADRLERFGLSGLASLRPQVLSAGQKQRLALAAATGREPALLLCDEPTALQDEAQAAWVLDYLDAWRRRPGRALVTATCDRREMERADEVIVLREGRVAAAGSAGELRDHPLVEELLGAASGEAVRPVAATAGEGEPVLRLEGVGCRFAGPGGGIGPLDLVLRPGERLGFHGPNGCGKSTLLGVCAGVRPPDEGRVRLAGQALYARGRRDLDHGLALLAPQFAEYLFTRTSVAAEIDLDPALAGCDHETLLADLGLPADVLGRNPHDLSTGQKRRLALGLVVLARRPLVLLDEPTAALDRAGRRRVLELLERLPADSALLVASHDRDFLAAAGCRILELAPRTSSADQNGASGPESG